MYSEQDEIAGWRRDLDHSAVGAIERFLAWLGRHWLAVMVGFVGLIVLGGFTNTILDAVGLTGAGAFNFRAYSLICTQIPGHSYWPFGFQMAMCQRDLAIFASFFIGGIAFAVTGRRWPQLGWKWYLLMLVPIAIDGGTQLFGWRHSTWWLRSLTGGLFGVANAWMILPTMQWAMKGVVETIKSESAQKPGETAPEEQKAAE